MSESPNIIKIATQTLCILTYPLFMPTYGMILFCVSFSQHFMVLPIGYCFTVCIATLFFTCILPLSLILYMWKKGQVSDLYITNPKQRTMPYLYSIIGFIAWIFFIGKTMHAPSYLFVPAIGGTIALGLVTLINQYWKISAHLCGIGGLLGGILCYAMAIASWPILTVLIILIISLLLMYARIYLNAHSSGQVVAGYLLGLSCTTLPYWILYA